MNGDQYWKLELAERERKALIAKIREEIEEEKDGLRDIIAYGGSDSLEGDNLRRAIELGLL